MSELSFIAAAREVIIHLREDADFNRSWTDGRRGDRLKSSDGYTARRLEVAEERERWAAAIEALVNRVCVKKLSDDEVLAGAKYYARASAQRAVNGVIPNWDDEADEANWQRTMPTVCQGMVDMVRGIIVACEYKRREDAAFERAKDILADADRRDFGA